MIREAWMVVSTEGKFLAMPFIGWTNDSEQALQLARERDAVAVIEQMKLQSIALPQEFVWQMLDEI